MNSLIWILVIRLGCDGSGCLVSEEIMYGSQRECEQQAKKVRLTDGENSSKHSIVYCTSRPAR